MKSLKYQANELKNLELLKYTLQCLNKLIDNKIKKLQDEKKQINIIKGNLPDFDIVMFGIISFIIFNLVCFLILLILNVDFRNANKENMRFFDIVKLWFSNEMGKNYYIFLYSSITIFGLSALRVIIRTVVDIWDAYSILKIKLNNECTSYFNLKKKLDNSILEFKNFKEKNLNTNKEIDAKVQTICTEIDFDFINISVTLVLKLCDELGKDEFELKDFIKKVNYKFFKELSEPSLIRESYYNKRRLQKNLIIYFYINKINNIIEMYDFDNVENNNIVIDKIKKVFEFSYQENVYEELFLN